jgi:hypothetical protein
MILLENVTFMKQSSLTLLGLLIGSVECGTRCKELWVTSSYMDGYKEGEDENGKA